MKRLAIVLLILVSGGLLGRILAGRPGLNLNEASPAALLADVQELAHLVTARVRVLNVLVTRTDGYLGGLRLLHIASGDVLLSVDLGAARLENIDCETREAILVLPPPRIISPRLDQAASRVFALEATGLWRFLPTDAGRSQLVDRAMREAQGAIARAGRVRAAQPEFRKRTEGRLAAFFRDALGWKLQVRWEGDLEP